MRFLLKKLYFVLILALVIVCFLQITVFGRQYNWVGDPEVSKWKVYDGDTQIKDKIICDDYNDSGTAYYYYIDKDGYMLTDTICPDYHIVDAFGRRLDKYGVLEKEILFTKTEEEVAEEYNAYLQSLVLAEQDISDYNYDGVKSEGVIGKSVDHFGPNLFIDNTQNNATKTILGKGVVLKEKESVYDPTINNELVDYIKDGNSYSKSANGTSYTKVKWTSVMALKGDGSYINFNNPKNNFNKVTGRIAMQAIKTTDEKDSTMRLIIYNDKDEELYSTSEFNYNGGKRFSCTFSKRTKWIRLELEIDGASTTRYAMLKDVKFGFDKRAYEEEKEEYAMDEEMGVLNITSGYYDIDEEMVGADGYTDEERRALASDSIAHMRDEEDDDEDDEDDDETDDEGDSNNGVNPDNVNSSSSDDNTTGPNFDTKLKEKADRESKTGPAFVVQ